MKRLLLGLFVVLLTGCTMPSHLTHAQSQDVHIRIDAQFDPERCEYKAKSPEVKAIGITTFS